ncbi:Uncharacterised protein [Yersinia bercovieri]|nr:Uncharacterised protein [Yersinia bercovieri]
MSGLMETLISWKQFEGMECFFGGDNWVLEIIMGRAG